MARMIPAQIDQGTSSPGEKEIFRRLVDDPTTKGWIVLHSLDIASHAKRVAGEADLVIVVPCKGVLCLEVKACRTVRRDQGLWYYGSNDLPDRRGPFKQSSEAMHSIRKRVIEQSRRLSSVPFWSAVIFPYLEFHVNSGEWHQWQVIDNRGFRSKPIGTLILQVLEHARKFLQSKRALWFIEDHNEPTMHQCEEIAKILRPNFELYESPRHKIMRLEQEVKHYTEEQLVALDAMETNPRVIFSGPAGTGKTVLAIESTRRSQAAGNRVLLLCYNRLLGRHLEIETDPIQPNLTVRTLHKHMLTVSGISLHGESPTPQFWQEELPQQAIDKLLSDTTENHLFDEIIIDEAQDLLCNNYLDFIDLSLKGGMSAGKWKMFGDFEKQAIYGVYNDVSLDTAVTSRFSNVPRYSLRINCRNTPRIVSLVHLLSDLDPEYLRILRPDDGVEPEILYYRNQEEQKRLLLQAIRSLKKEGFARNHITALSMKAPDKSITRAVTLSDGVDFTSFEDGSERHVRSGSIHAFKGMESPAIIVTDVETIVGEQATSLFYIAMTRALHRLYILAHEDVKHDVLKRILQP